MNKHYFITALGNIYCAEDLQIGSHHIERLKNIGNYFNSEEKAKKFLEKQMAWTRLQDKGFSFNGWIIDDGLRISICTNTDEDDIYDEDKRRIKPDLDLVFGVEE